MRIAMLYTPLTQAGGAERQFLEEARLLRGRGHDVRILTFALDDRALFAGGVARRDVRLLPSRGGWPRQVAALRWALAEIRPHLLVSHTSPELTWLATRGDVAPYVQYHNSPPFYIGADANPCMASRRYRRVRASMRDRIAGDAHFDYNGGVSPARAALAELRTALKHRALRDARAVVVPSLRTARELRLLHGVEATVVRGCLPASALAPRRADPIRNGVAPDGERIILSICRLERVKRIDLLLHAFSVIRASRPDVRLVIGGAGADRARLEAIARSLGLGERVTFAGYVPEERLADCYAGADVFAAPAMADFNIAPYEALAAGARVVWTTEMETEPAIESSGQVFVAEPEPEAFARAIITALDAGPSRRADLRSMTWDARGDRIDALFRRAAGVAAPDRHGERMPA